MNPGIHKQLYGVAFPSSASSVIFLIFCFPGAPLLILCLESWGSSYFAVLCTFVIMPIFGQRFINFIDLLKEPAFGFTDFLYFSLFYFIVSVLFSFVSSAYVEFNLLLFFYFPKVEADMIIGDLLEYRLFSDYFYNFLFCPYFLAFGL